MQTKLIYSLLLAFLFSGLTACKKKYDYSCKCKFTDGKTYNTTYYSDVDKTEAENRCASQEQAINSTDSIATNNVTCSVK